MATTNDDFQALIDSKRILVADIIAKITQMNATILTITTNPRPSYSIDLQEVSWGDYLKSLTSGVESLAKAQKIELESINQLLDLQIRNAAPFQYQSGSW